MMMVIAAGSGPSACVLWMRPNLLDTTAGTAQLHYGPVMRDGHTLIGRAALRSARIRRDAEAVTPLQQPSSHWHG